MELLNFEWDEEKNEANKRKHGVGFDTAMLIWEDADRIERYDDIHSVDEDRWISIGKVKDVLFVVHTDRGEAIRIISARIATKQEREEYYGQSNY